MISRLRKKFILINMLLVGGVLLVVCGAICIASYQQLETESIGALKMAVSHRYGDPPPRLEVGPHGNDKRPDKQLFSIPVFVAKVDEQGAVMEVQGENIEISDDDLDEIIAQALASDQRVGVLTRFHLRFMVDESPDGIQIAFADRSGELRSLGSMLLTALASFVVALGALYGASVYLAQWALQPVAQAWKQQQQFVADASHELKTPLTVILANMGILLAHQEDTVHAQAKWLENTQAEAVRMKKLVDDLLFLAKSDAARTSVKHVAVDLSDVVWSGVLPFESLAFERKVLLESTIDSDLWTIGDEGQLRQLVAILLDNACKYVDPDGTVTVQLRQQAEKAGGTYPNTKMVDYLKSSVCLWVHNTGAPLSEEDREHLFERFYRADKSRARGQGGYGLGLAIAKSIVEAHGGKLTVDDSGDGVAFAAALPQIQAPQLALHD